MDIRMEIVFWTRIMRDHAEFQYISLAPEETEATNRAAYFMNLFDRLNAEARSTQVPITTLISSCKEAVLQFIDFKRQLLTRVMTCSIKLRMTPSFINHMINEALEFLHVLNLADGTIAYNVVLENLRVHKIWLPDASGHASAIAAELDPIEAEIIKKAEYFSKKFDKLFKKAFEMYTMYERTGLTNGALQYFNEEVINALSEFIMYLEKVEALRSGCRVFATGTFAPLLPNHMKREEDYYINKINRFMELNS